MTPLRYLPSFHRDVEDIWLHVARDNQAAADRLLWSLYERCEILRDHPQAGPARPDLGAGCRQLTEGNYLILYRVLDGSIELVRAMHSRRRITPDLVAG